MRGLLSASLALALSAPALASGFSGDGFGSPGFFQQGINIPTVPPWVPAGAQMFVDFPNNRAWDGIAQIITTPDTLLSDTRAAVIPYDPGTGITTSIAANTLPYGSAGLQLFQVNNMLAQSGGDYTVAGGIWSAPHAIIAAPTITKNTAGCTVAQQAPDGSCNTTEIVIPPSVGTTSASALQQHVTPATASTMYTCYLWAKNATTGGTPQIYLSAQNGGSPNAEFINAFIQPGDTWRRFALQIPLGAGQTSFYFNFGAGSGLSTVPTAPNKESPNQPGGTFEAWLSGCSPGDAAAPYVATTTVPLPTVALDNIVATGDLATALQGSAGAVDITTAKGNVGVAGTLLDANGTVFLGKLASGATTTSLGAALSSVSVQTFTADSYLSWSGSAGSISLNGATAITDATSRTPGTGPFHLGTTSGTSASPHTYITTMAVYPTAVAPVVVASLPITSISFGTIATLSSGTLQGGAPATFINGDSWAPTVAPDGTIWSFCDDCGYGTYTTVGGNVLLTEMTWSGGNHGYYDMGTTTWAGVKGLVNAFNSALGTFTQVQAGTQNTWKSRGLVALQDGANIDLFGGLDADIYGGAFPTNNPSWIQLRLGGGSIISVVNPAAASPNGASVTTNFSGMPPAPPVLPATTPTFTSTHFGAPGFVQYPAGTYCTGSLDGSGSFVYAVSNDEAYNRGSNAYLGRIACATILTSLGGSPAAASTPASWQFYDTANGGCTGTGIDPNCWTSTLANATPIFTLTNKLGVVGMSYLPTGNRYLLTSFYNPFLNGNTANTETQAAMAGASNLVFADCDKPWHCTATQLPEVHFSTDTQAFYDPALVMSSLSTDGGYTGSMIFAGNFTKLTNNFSTASVYTPTIGQIVIHR